MPIFTTSLPEILSGYFDIEEFEFFSEEELLNLPCVASWTKPTTPHDDKNPYFHQFSLRGNDLMVESFGGRYWCKIGKVSSTKGLTLPELKESNETNTKKR